MFVLVITCYNVFRDNCCFCAPEYYNQFQYVMVSECTHTHAHEVCLPLCYTWKRCKVSLRKREPSQEMDLCLMVCTSPNAKVHGVLAVTDEGWEEVQCNNKYLCYPPCEPPSFTVHVHSSCSCANALQCADVMLTLLHSCIKSDGSYTHTNTCSAFLWKHGS